MPLAFLIPSPMLLVAPLLVLALVMGLAVLAFTTAHCAQSHGRSFWLWFALGWALPLISFCLLFALVLRYHLNHGQRLLDDAKAILAAAEAAEKCGNETPELFKLYRVFSGFRSQLLTPCAAQAPVLKQPCSK